MTHVGEATFFREGPILALPELIAGQQSWFAVQTKPRHEKRVAAELEEKGVVAFSFRCSPRCISGATVSARLSFHYSRLMCSSRLAGTGAVVPRCYRRTAYSAL